MEFEATGEPAEGGGYVTWPSAMSSFVLTYLANVVASNKTSSGFKKTHLNSYGKALNAHFKCKRTGEQISNHLRTKKRKYVRINKLRSLSGALWDEVNYVISLDHEHYTSYIEDHKVDAEFFNKPIEHYDEMATIFGATAATKKYAMGSNEPLATGIVENEQGEGGGDGDTAAHGATSSVTRPNKRAKTTGKGEER